MHALIRLLAHSKRLSSTHCLYDKSVILFKANSLTSYQKSKESFIILLFPESRISDKSYHMSWDV